MRLGYFTLPVHPLNKSYYKILKENTQATIFIDKLGYSEALFGEHLTDEYERITSSMVFISSLIGVTKNIKLGTGTVNLPNYHPAFVAGCISMLDHLSKGRIIFGIGPGSLISDSEIMGNLSLNRNEMFLESINQILKLWKCKPPYDLKGKYWNISSKLTHDKKVNIGTMPKPFQSPHPEILCTSLSRNHVSINALTSRGWNLMSSNLVQKETLKIHGDIIKDNKKRINNLNWRVVRMIFINTNRNLCKDYVFAQKSPYRQSLMQVLIKLKKYKRLEILKKNPDDKREKISIDSLIKNLVIYGDVNEVSDKINNLKESIGNFNTLTYMGMDWLSPKLAKNSLALMSEKVLHKI
jgi:alkanesulfonate monooxygenase SsuD/methylene tetrahydromethanopterin reductase-like flavin-dependent oxidoreductase (luciferase family)